MIAFKTIPRTKHEHSTSSDGHDQADSAEVVALAFASHRVSARGVRHAATTLKRTRRGWVSVFLEKMGRNAQYFGFNCVFCT